MGELVSVILATCDEVTLVRARIDNILKTSFPGERIEVIVGIDSSASRISVSDLAEGLDPRVKVVEGDSPGGKASTLNAAVRRSSHEILVFADTAQSFDSHAIPHLVQALRDPTVGAVSGMLEFPSRQRGATIADHYWRYERSLRRAESRVRSVVGVTGAIYATRRDIWQPLPAGLILDDLYVPMRLVIAGWRVDFSDRARAMDARRFSPSQERRRKIRTLTGVFQLCAWLPQVLSPWTNPVWIEFVCHKLLRLLTPYLVLACVLTLGWRLATKLATAPVGIVVAIVLVAVAAALVSSPARKAITTQLQWAIALQTSVVVATFNGVRRRWDVW